MIDQEHEVIDGDGAVDGKNWETKSRLCCEQTFL